MNLEDKVPNKVKENIFQIFLAIFSVYSWLIMVFAAGLGYVYVQEISQFSFVHLLMLTLIFYPLYYIYKNSGVFKDWETFRGYVIDNKWKIVVFGVLLAVAVQDFWPNVVTTVLGLPLTSLGQFLFAGKVVIDQFIGDLAADILFDLSRLHILFLWLFVIVNTSYDAVTRLLK